MTQGNWSDKAKETAPPPQNPIQAMPDADTERKERLAKIFNKSVTISEQNDRLAEQNNAQSNVNTLEWGQNCNLTFAFYRRRCLLRRLNRGWEFRSKSRITSQWPKIPTKWDHLAFLNLNRFSVLDAHRKTLAGKELKQRPTLLTSPPLP